MRRITDKIFGGIDMSWWKVIVFAVATAVVTAVFLIVPVFLNTSFIEMGTTFEMWVLFAMIIMTNCKKPLESALKTFVFFLISQPLIYLFQVPFSSLGWQLFTYYYRWFIFTLLTFPMAFAGWYVKKGNWLSLLILTPINLLLGWTGLLYVTERLIPNFPNHLIAVIVCFGQILLYLYAFFRKFYYWLAGLGAVLIPLVIWRMLTPALEYGISMPAPDGATFSSSAVAVLEDGDFGTATITAPEEGHFQLQLNKLGETDLAITDGGKTYRYHVTTYRDDTGHPQVKVVPAE